MNQQEVLEMLRPAHALWKEDHFQQWAKKTEAELEELTKAGLIVTKANAGKNPYHQMLTSVGMDPPENQEESLRLYLVLRGVVTFWRRKLDHLKVQSSEFEKLEKQLNALGRADGSIGKHRIAAR